MSKSMQTSRINMHSLSNLNMHQSGKHSREMDNELTMRRLAGQYTSLSEKGGHLDGHIRRCSANGSRSVSRDLNTEVAYFGRT